MVAHPRSSDAVALLEREHEVARLAELVHGAPERRGGLVVIEGAAGIGKTRLLQHAGQVAEQAGMTVLTASGNELEHEFAFGGSNMTSRPRSSRSSRPPEGALRRRRRTGCAWRTAR